MNARWITGGALALYLLLLLGAGFWAARRTRDFRDYVTGGGAIPAWMLALSFLANYISANSFVGHAGKSYEVGLIWCVVPVIIVVACAISWNYFAPRFAAFAKDGSVTTLPDFFEKRFGSRRLAIFVHWIVVAATLLYVLAVLRSTALVVASGLGLSYSAALLIIYAVTIVYCFLGGMWADVSTDVVQAFILIAGAIALIIAVHGAPTPHDIVAPPPIRPAPLGLVIAVGMAGGLKLLADPKQVMVFYAFRDEIAARRFRWAGPLMLLVAYACLFPVGFLARRILGGVPDPEQLVPTLVFERMLLGSWFGALFMVALLAASMSSLDSALLVMASCLEKHVAAPLAGGLPSSTRTRVLLVASATLALALSFRPLGGIIELTAFAGSLLGAALLPSIAIGLTGSPVSARAVSISVAAGVIGTLGGKFLPGLLGIRSPWVQDVFIGLAASSLALVPWVRGQGGSASAPAR